MEYEEKIKIMEQYLALKVSERDWHGVADCAMDLREIEAEHKPKLYAKIHIPQVTLKKHAENEPGYPIVMGDLV